MLTCNWNKKCGEVTVKMWTKNGGEEFTYNMYDCNALAMWVEEYMEDGIEKSQLAGFFVDEEHAKNCFGLSKGYKENIHEDWIKVKLNVSYPKMRKLAQIIVRAYDNIQIELYKEEKETVESK